MAELGLDAALDSLIWAIAVRDLSATLACLTAKHDPAVWGSEVGEAAVGLVGITAFFRRVYDRPAPFRFNFPERSWTVHEDVAWLTAEGSVVEPSAEDAKGYRLTAVFVHEQDAWKLALWSGAEPVHAGSGSS